MNQPLPLPETYHFRNFHIPPNMMRGLIRYINKGIRPGQFLQAVLENDLSEACNRGDDLNLTNLPAYIGYLYNKAPCYCWGSPEKVTAWIEQGGLQGKETKSVMNKTGE